MSIQDDFLQGFRSLGQSTTAGGRRRGASPLADSLQNLGQLQSADRRSLPQDLGSIFGNALLDRLSALIQQNVTQSGSSRAPAPSGTASHDARAPLSLDRIPRVPSSETD